MDDGKTDAPVSAPVKAPSAPTVAKVTMRHPHTGDTVQVDDGAAAVPYMLRGYGQVNAGGAK